jgi:hypothetical protein
MRLSTWRTLGVLAVALAAIECKRTSTAQPDEAGEAPECEAYAADYERCLTSLARKDRVDSTFADSTRAALRVASKDPSSRGRLNERCRAARAQLEATCQ